MSFRECICWKDTIVDEMDSIIFNNTWEIVDLEKRSKSMIVNGCLEGNINPMVNSILIKLNW